MPSQRKKSFRESLSSSPLSIIAECKKASPSAGVIKPDYDAITTAKTYELGGAKAISVLTDEPFFQGSLADLQNVSTNVAIPTLRKDFILEEIQIEEAKAYGASAVLLIVRILEPNQLQKLLRFANSLDLDVLVETHTREEVAMAIDAGATILGINTRDLDTFQLHPNLIHELSAEIPKGIWKVGESGIGSKKDYESFRGVVDSLLIGTYFMKSPEPLKTLKELTNL